MRLVDADYIKESVKRQCDNCRKEGMKWMADSVERAIIEELDNTPTAHPQWIPCSERLPHGSCSDLVNVSIHDDSGDTPYDYTSCGWITTDGEYWIVDNEINNHVVAWIPLPKPYGGDDK